MKAAAIYWLLEVTLFGIIAYLFPGGLEWNSTFAGIVLCVFLWIPAIGFKTAVDIWKDDSQKTQPPL